MNGHHGLSLRSSHHLASVLALACSGCFFIGTRPPAAAKPKNLSPLPLDAHVDIARTKGAEFSFQIGSLPRDLSVPPDRRELSDEQRMAALTAGVEHNPTAFNMNEHHDFLFAGLRYRGVEGDMLCLSARTNVGTSSLRADDIASKYSDVLRAQDSGLWIAAVDSLDALRGRPTWPEGEAAKRLVSVTVLSDEIETKVEKIDVGNGEFIEKKKLQRIVEVKVCGDKPPIAPTARWLVALGHSAPAEDDATWIENLDAKDGPELERRLRLQWDSLFVWALSDTGAFDLSK